ncbi:MAG: hypothetical protein AAFV45_13935 [Pseudomonadota bacterium]
MFIQGVRWRWLAAAIRLKTQQKSKVASLVLQRIHLLEAIESTGVSEHFHTLQHKKTAPKIFGAAMT